jgi:hypothetical protein
VIVVSDTSPITNLSAIGQLDLLRHLYGSIVIPQAVYNEMVAAGKPVPGAIEVQTLSRIQVQNIDDVQRVAALQASQDNIDLGEAEAIAPTNLCRRLRSARNGCLLARVLRRRPQPEDTRKV